MAAKKFCGPGGVAYSSASTEWGTPSELFEELDAEFDFQLDVCATKSNAKCLNFFSPEQDGLMHPWRARRCFLNPPYARGVIDMWVRKAYDESRQGALVVCLLPARTDTRWFHNYVMRADEIRLVSRRLKFTLDGQTLSPAPFPSAIVIFRPRSRNSSEWITPLVLGFTQRGKGRGRGNGMSELGLERAVLGVLMYLPNQKGRHLASDMLCGATPRDKRNLRRLLKLVEGVDQKSLDLVDPNFNVARARETLRKHLGLQPSGVRKPKKAPKLRKGGKLALAWGKRR